MSKPFPCLLSGLVLLLFSMAVLNYSTGIDDAHITFFSAWSLVQQGEIVNYNLDRVEQSSSLLHTLVTAALMALADCGPVLAGHAVTLVAALLVLPVVYGLAVRFACSPFVCVVLLAGNSSFIYWALSGLESPVVTLLMLGWLISGATLCQFTTPFHRFLFLVSSLLLVSVRPEMPLYLPVLMLSLALPLRYFLPDKVSWTIILQMVVFVFLAAMLVFGFRYSYFGSLFPQPVEAKAGSFTLARLMTGFYYFIRPLASPMLLPVYLLGLLSVVSMTLKLPKKSLNLYQCLALFCLLSYCGLIILMGGDWMSAYRFFVPVTGVFVLLVGSCLNRFSAGKQLGIVFLVTVCQLAFTHSLRESVSPAGFSGDADLIDSSRYDFFERQSRDNLVNIPTVNFLHKLVPELLHTEGQLTVLSGQMGMLSYNLATLYPGRIHFLDRNGLIEKSFTDCEVTKDKPRGALGIEGIVPYYYLLARKKLANKCDIPEADIIFDIWQASALGDTREMMNKFGYQIVFEQHGHLEPEIWQLVAVKKSLWQSIGSPGLQKVTVHF
ncbi:MAG: hypothetical protein KDI30_07615 [Pseudomonadales bacterium]|nr:hypothetical protein [Pseudomonadales bacterium]